MRKLCFLALTLLLAALCLSASAQTYLYDDLRATMDVPDEFIVLTPDNLSSFDEWLTAKGKTSETVANDMLARGVLMQAWSQEGDICFEFSAVRDARAENLWDVNEQTSSIRATYRLSHYPNNEYPGYEFSSADWKNTDNGRFLILRYLRRENGEIDHRGLMRRTIRNGYEITFDWQVYGRALTNKDNSALNKIWESFNFVEILPLPPAASAKINFTDIPPTETNDASFALAGTAAEGVKLTATVMGLNYPDPLLFSVEVGKSGKFKLPIDLPKEGVFLITVTAEYQGAVVSELAYPVTYQRTLLSVNVTTEVPEIITTDEFSILGTSVPGATIQVFINDEVAFSKKVTAAGRFKIELDTSEEGVYDVVLAFSKKNLADRRFPYHFTREWSQADMIRKLDSESISPGYATLVKKIDGYDGRTMGYKCYVVAITQAGDEWIIKLAMSKKGDEYRSILLVTASAEPTLEIGAQVMMYGRCAGMSIPSEDSVDTESYPCFDLLLFASVE